MDFSKQALTYVFLIIPLLFAGAVFVQGFIKINKGEKDGTMGVIFGVFLFILVIATYFMFIR